MLNIYCRFLAIPFCQNWCATRPGCRGQTVEGRIKHHNKAHDSKALPCVLHVDLGLIVCRTLRTVNIPGASCSPKNAFFPLEGTFLCLKMHSSMSSTDIGFKIFLVVSELIEQQNNFDIPGNLPKSIFKEKPLYGRKIIAKYTGMHLINAHFQKLVEISFF